MLLEQNDDYPETFIIPATTHADDRESINTETSAYPQYPGLKATRKWNKRMNTAAKRENAAKFRRKIERRSPTGSFTKRTKNKLLVDLMLLRPSKAALRVYYRNQNFTPQMVELMVNGPQFEQLPAIKISAQDFNTLCDLIHAQEVR